MLFVRLKAAIFDALLMVVVIFILDAVFSNVEFSSSTPKIIILVIVFFLYDPLLTSFFGGTAGHYFTGIAVKKEMGQKENISLHKALIRSFLKYVLGWVSLLTIGLTNRSKAIHDIAVGSVVVYRG